eukprot:7371113-Prymnesium_polylepis.1
MAHVTGAGGRVASRGTAGVRARRRHPSRAQYASQEDDAQVAARPTVEHFDRREQQMGARWPAARGVLDRPAVCASDPQHMDDVGILVGCVERGAIRGDAVEREGCVDPRQRPACTWAQEAHRLHLPPVSNSSPTCPTPLPPA